MSVDEFNSWLDYHCQLFPEWLNYTGGDSEPKLQLLNELHAALREYSSDRVKWASLRLYRRPGNLFPSQHLAALLELLNESAQREPLAAELNERRCGQCRGSGMVSVWARAGQFRSAQGREIPEGIVISTACPCDVGQRINALRAHPKTDPISGKPIRDIDRSMARRTFELAEFDRETMDPSDWWIHQRDREPSEKPRRLTIGGSG